MYIRLSYLDVDGFREEVVLFDRDDYAKVSNVFHKKRHSFTKYVTLKLYNEHNRRRRNSEEVDQGREYTLNHQRRTTNIKIVVFEIFVTLNCYF